jgi:hypothetical protein
MEQRVQTLRGGLFLAKTLDFLPDEGRTHEGISRHPARLLLL